MEQHEPSSAAPSDDPPGEVALLDHVRALIAWRREMFLAVVLAALAGALSLLALGPEYEATATVAVVSRGARALEDGVQGGAVVQLFREASTAQRTALLGLVHHTSVARAVVEALGERLTEDERDLQRLLESVSTTTLLTLQDRNLIPIDVTANSPEKAAAIANAWAEAYVREVNRLFATSPPGAAAMDPSLVEAEEAWADAQRELEAFIAASDREWLRQRILETRRRLDVRRTLGLALDDARSLLAQIERGSEAGADSNAVAILLLKIRVFGASTQAAADSAAPGRRARDDRRAAPDSQTAVQTLSIVQASPNLSLEIDAVATDRASQIAEARALIETIRERRRRLDRPSADLPADWYAVAEHTGAEGGDDPGESPAAAPASTGGPERDLQLLRARSSAARAVQDRLEAERDLRRDTLAALREVRLATGVFAEEVRLASPAIPPRSRPLWFAILLRAGIGGVLGALASMLLALAANFLGVRPLLEARA